jgi:hypothetical protein
MSWGAVISQVGQSYFSMSEAYNKSKILESQSKLDVTLAGIEARSMERQAISVENQGVRAAMIEQHKTKTVTSDAIAAMAAGGGGIDPLMLARIKQRGDYNSMSAIFDARTQAIDLRMQADMTRIGATYEAGASKRRGDALKREARTGAIFNSMDLFAKAYTPTPKTKLTTYKPSGFERRN